jgi:hypothetical protein
MLDINQFRESILKSTLNDLLMYSPEAEELLVFTCANESRGGTYIRQINGPALGIFQMQPETHTDLWVNYIQMKSNLSMIMISNFNVVRVPEPDRLIYDLRYATAMARIFYARIKEPLPKVDDVDNLWWYYKTYYNTQYGKAQKEWAIKWYEGFKGSHD